MTHEVSRVGKVAFTFDDRRIEAGPGDTLGASLMRAGVVTLRRSWSNQPRGLYCGIGVCNDCLVTVDGKPNVRACVTSVVEGAVVRSQGRR
jgi:predicted molibdopterin-dependent oxidoreductase YjgC